MSTRTIARTLAHTLRSLLAWLCLLPLAASAMAPGTHRMELVHGGLTRYYLVHMPQRLSPQPRLVLAFHGGGGHAEIMARDRLYGLVEQSELSGDVLVFPSGYSRWPRGRLATWNAGLCCGEARDRNVDDIGFVRALLDHLRTQWAYDARRVYAIGMSNGGMLAHRLACEMPGTFAAIGAVAGTDGTPRCVPSKPVSVLHIHARDDDRVLFGGGSGSASATHADFVSVADTIDKWVKGESCRVRPERVLNVAGAYCDRYAACEGGAEVQLCVTETGGHSWPGGRKALGGAPGSTALSANEVIWDFFGRHPGGR
ncbi:MAG: hypothetical protein KF871_18510 [Hydrogenophaga sp.]|uniref:alpha/beta hydrolase family esterase n=1 Tax=Hydrogenophaga sp. TaxID=1904254 RepID=UPI001D7389C1|nr:PHB depolymerase family esterase [Hydrogenophaga sp.]MBX3611891.1 hypothetical protein [Hydrogenophaga sp.]